MSLGSGREGIDRAGVHLLVEEFTGLSTVRHCARSALSVLGLPPAPILTGPDREPLWPDGVIGSLTHCQGYRAAAVTNSVEEIAAIGIDAEPDIPLPEEVLEYVSRATERDGLASVSHVDVNLGRLLFSAKESVYKAWFPLMRRWLGFGEVEVELDLEAGEFTAHFRVPGPVLAGRRLDSVSGRWAAGRGLLVTAIVLPHDSL